jgi:hypothetical protein
MSAHVGGLDVLARILKPFAVRALQRETRSHLAHLKSLLETPDGRGQPS